MWIIFATLVIGLCIALGLKRRNTVCKQGSYTIEAYCRDKESRLFFITLNYDTWEEACKIRNGMVGNDYLELDYNDKIHHYTVLSTKIYKVGQHDK